MSIHVGFLGLGGIAQREMQTLSQVKDVKFAGLCDVDAGRASAAAQKFGGKPYTDFDQMLSAEKMDALFVALPPFAHTDQEVRAVQKGIHLFVNKPVASSLARSSRSWLNFCHKSSAMNSRLVFSQSGRRVALLPTRLAKNGLAARRMSACSTSSVVLAA